jgi:hypothetical protein
MGHFQKEFFRSLFSPATCIGCDMKVVMGDPDPAHVSTS